MASSSTLTIHGVLSDFFNIKKRQPCKRGEKSERDDRAKKKKMAEKKFETSSPIFASYAAVEDREQGDQIGRIFAECVMLNIFVVKPSRMNPQMNIDDKIWQI
jgi:hypothetical protein